MPQDNFGQSAAEKGPSDLNSGIRAPSMLGSVAEGSGAIATAMEHLASDQQLYPP